MAIPGPSVTPGVSPYTRPRLALGRRVRELPLLAVLAVVAAGLALGALGYWRTGSMLVGCGVLLAGALRLVLPPRQVGLLAVRSRRLDVVALAALGALLVTLAVTVPAP